MLAAMGERSFVVTIAYIKTEPIHVALFGFIFLGDKVTLPMAVAILVATAGVIVMSTKGAKLGEMSGGIRPTANTGSVKRFIGVLPRKCPHHSDCVTTSHYKTRTPIIP